MVSELHANLLYAWAWQGRRKKSRGVGDLPIVAVYITTSILQGHFYFAMSWL